MEYRTSSYLITEDESRRIDIFKVWLALMVVFIHSYSEGMNIFGGTSLEVPVWLETLKYVISQLISRCAVPAFYLISAVLLYKKEFKWIDNIKNKVRRLLIPYLLLNTFWICFLWLVQLVDEFKVLFSGSAFAISEWEILDFVNAYVGYTGYPILYPLWFIRDLFILNILAKWISSIIDRFPRTILCILLIVWIIDISTGIFCLATQAICFFSFGYYIVKYNIRLSSVDKLNGIVWLLIYFFLILFDVITKDLIIIHTIIHQICIIVGVGFGFRCMTKIKNSRINKCMLFISKYSFCVYIFHEMSLTVLKKVGMVLLPLTPLSQLIQYLTIPFIIFGCCIIAGMLLDRFFPRIYSLLTGRG